MKTNELQESKGLATPEVSKSGLRYNQQDREFIRNFYNECENKSSLWIWWNKPNFVSVYEVEIAQKNFKKELQKVVLNSKLYKIIVKVNGWLSYHFC